MNSDLRKQFFQNVLCILLDKSNNAKVIASIMKYLSEWMKLAVNVYYFFAFCWQLFSVLAECSAFVEGTTGAVDQTEPER